MKKITLKQVNASDIKALTTGIKYSAKERELFKSWGVTTKEIDKLEEIVEEIWLSKDLKLVYSKNENTIRVEPTEITHEVVGVTDDIDLVVLADAINMDLKKLYDANYEDCGEFWEIIIEE